jgi:hypothetical protein
MVVTARRCAKRRFLRLSLLALPEGVPKRSPATANIQIKMHFIIVLSRFSATYCSVLVPNGRSTCERGPVMKPITAPIVGGMITSTIHVLILAPVFFAFMKERALRHETLKLSSNQESE